MTQLNLTRLMQHPVVELDPDTEVGFALDVATTLHTHYFPLMREGSLVGIVCTCDLDDAPRGQHICELSHPDVLTVPANIELDDVARLMRERVVGSAVVMDGSGMCGLVTREALAKASPEWAAYFADQHCEACGALTHLRRCHDEGLLCCSCAARAHDADWQETGTGG